jgi:hypothetical protein
MTFTYSGNPAASDKDAVRFLLNDTTEANETNISDEEINYLLAQWENVYEAARAGAEHLAATYAQLADTSKSVGDISISKTYSNQAAQYHTLAQSLYQQRLRKSGPIPVVNPEAIQSTVNREPFTPTTDFVVGQMDNPSPTAPGTGILDGY